MVGLSKGTGTGGLNVVVARLTREESGVGVTDNDGTKRSAARRYPWRLVSATFKKVGDCGSMEM